MKKFILIIILILCFGLVCCNVKENNTEPIKTETETKISTETKTETKVSTETETKQKTELPIETETKQKTELPIETETEQKTELPIETEIPNIIFIDPQEIIRYSSNNKKYELYLNLSYFKGLELYCYIVDDHYECVLMSGTNRLKTADEIKYLQAKYPCTLCDMKKILSFYPDDVSIAICIVNFNSFEDMELTYNTEETKKIREYLESEETFEPTQSESLINLKDYLIDVDCITGYYGPISSFIYFSTNKDIINYLVEEASNIVFQETLTDENYDEIISFGRNLTVSFSMPNSQLVLYLTDANNMYAIYYENNDSGHTNIWQYKAINPPQYITFLPFCAPMGMPANYFVCKTPICSKYLEGYNTIGLYEYDQNNIMKNYIFEFAPLSLHYKKGILFGGYISNCYGKYNDYYALMINADWLGYYEAFVTKTVDGVDFTYTNSNEIIITDGRHFYSIEEAYNLNILSHNDLVTISHNLIESINKK